jgi:hypothetical protein
MNKATIKDFAIWARNKLIADITYKAGLLGISEQEIKSPLPQSTRDVQFFDIGTREPYSISGVEIEQREKLAKRIREKANQSDHRIAYKAIVEEVAYTWFNRLIAVRFMEVNNYLPSQIRVLSSESEGKLEPDLVTTPLESDLEFSTREKERILQLQRDNQTDELFRMLFIKQCNSLNVVLPELFEKTNDYTELLLNVSFTDKDGVVCHLVHDIEEDDFNIDKEGQVEIIGWLYQYYNTEPKDEVFALLKKNVKITKERIPAATQLFTPDWIVRYMVENSLGRLWLDRDKAESSLTDEYVNASYYGWKYYLEEAEQESEVKSELAKMRNEYKELRPEDLKVIDPCMGSGHILVYAFDVLMQIYERYGYSPRDAAKLILEKNLYGLDIDKRAYQLAYFALLMKARQYNRRILSSGVYPQVYHPGGYSDGELFGSLINIDKLDPIPQQFLEQMSLDDIQYNDTLRIWNFKRLLSQKYDVVVTNPPYMGSSGMNNSLSDFVKKEYPNSKGDLSTAFMEKSLDFCNHNGLMAMINIPVWMFLSSYEKLREIIIRKNTVTSMAHFGRGVFGSDFGTTSFVISKRNIAGYKSTYRRLFEKQGAVDSVEQKENWFLEGIGNYTVQQEKFFKIPGMPIAYWVSENFIGTFENSTIFEYATVTNGMFTCDNKRFLRFWHEISKQDTLFNCASKQECEESSSKWYPYNKGGNFRRWYGNHEHVINFRNFGKEISNYRVASGQSASFPGQNFYFNESISWSFVSSSKFGVRYYPTGFVFDIAGSSIFPFDKDNTEYLLGVLASEVSFHVLNIINPTINYQAGDIRNIPVNFSIGVGLDFFVIHLYAIIQINSDTS